MKWWDSRWDLDSQRLAIWANVLLAEPSTQGIELGILITVRLRHWNFSPLKFTEFFLAPWWVRFFLSKISHKSQQIEIWLFLFGPLFCHIDDYFCHFGPRVYPLGSIVIALVPPSVSLSVFKYLRDRSLVFLVFCMKLGHHKGTKVTEPDFWKKILGGVTNGGKPPFWGYFWCFLSISLHPVIKSFWNYAWLWVSMK